ncbi:related to transcription co-repressor GAL80 [Cephalotrichum gorgonifer]|uniref:Related to transcription co-repressor GAL80 n=1 Tax=Cephalotrichum gorgonifer TaxID=2041049 RepID=A0AAE8N8X4_9PEZI|nr:related to transcription co-repressor GAL80 [Cephalotrichum gorgonifer]
MSKVPLPIALIGLSASPSWASGSHLPYLLSARGKAKYKIVALLNSSTEAARRAIEHHNLAAETRAYGSPQDLAADPTVKAVVCITRVDTHEAAIRPSIEAGKDVIVEWPLAHNASVAKELALLAEGRGIRTAVGLQGRATPVFRKVAEILDSDRIGKVLSSELNASGGPPVGTLGIGMKYFAQKEVEGNLVTIWFGHLFDSVQHILGTVESLNSTTQTRYPNIAIRDATGATVETLNADIPDLIFTSGPLPGSSRVTAGATLAARLRLGPPFKGEPPYVWTIGGENGELRLTSPTSAAVHAWADPIVIDIHDYATDEVTSVDWSWDDWQQELAMTVRNVAGTYEAFAEGGEYASFQDAAQRHEQVDSLLK